MYYRQEGEGVPLLLLHGMGSCGDDWAPQFAVFAGSYTVIAPDLRGHGRSDKPAGPYTIPQMAEDVADLLAGLGLFPAHVVGLSLGGLVAQVLAAGRPERVRSLVLVNTFARLRPQGVRGWLYFFARVAAMLVRGLDAQAEVVARGLFPRPEQEPLRRMAAQRLQANDPQAYRATMRAALRFDGRVDLGRIRAPTLVVAGLEDTTVSLAAKRELADGIPNARLEMLPGSGHATPLDAPAEFNRLLAAFIRAH